MSFIYTLARISLRLYALIILYTGSVVQKIASIMLRHALGLDEVYRSLVVKEFNYKNK